MIFFKLDSSQGSCFHPWLLGDQQEGLHPTGRQKAPVTPATNEQEGPQAPVTHEERHRSLLCSDWPFLKATSDKKASVSKYQKAPHNLNHSIFPKGRKNSSLQESFSSSSSSSFGVLNVNDYKNFWLLFIINLHC